MRFHVEWGVNTLGEMANKSPVVLVVEDSDAHRYVMERLLTAAGATVLSASCAEDGLLLMDSDLLDPPSVLVLDVRLPGMSGIELAQTLRKEPRFRATPIVLVTGYSPVFPAVATSVDAFLVKPVPEGVLEETVMRLAAAGRPDAKRAAELLRGTAVGS